MKMTKLSEQTISISSIIVSRPIIYIAVIVVIFTITIVINQILMYSMHSLQYMMTCVLPVYLRLIGINRCIFCVSTRLIYRCICLAVCLVLSSVSRCFSV